MIKSRLGNDPNQLISIFLDRRGVVASNPIIEIDGIVPLRFFFLLVHFLMDSFSGGIYYTEVLIAEAFANHGYKKKSEKKTRERNGTKNRRKKRDPSPPPGANFIRNRRFSLFRRLTLLLGLL